MYNASTSCVRVWIASLRPLNASCTIHLMVNKHSTSKDPLQEKIDELGLDIDLKADTTSHREIYLNALKLVEEATDAKERAKCEKALKSAENQYFLHYHEYLKEQMPFLLFDREEDKVYWQYNEKTGVYDEKKLVHMRGVVVKMLMDDEMNQRANEKGAKDILVRFRGEYVECGKVHDDFLQHGDWIHLKNGWLNIKTRKFEEHTPERLSLATMKTEYKKNATCPEWLKAVEHLAEGDESQMLILQEFAGYSLTTDTHLDRSLILVGEGQSGKSTIANTIFTMLGEDNATSTDLESINSNFGMFPLVGKKLNWIDEMLTTKYLESQRLKRLISGEPSVVEQKYRDSFTFIPTAKFLWTMNEMPRLADTSNGSYRRFIIIECNNVYTEDDKDVDIDDKLKAEHSGILNWALEGLKSLYERGDFEIVEKNRQAIEQYRKDNSPVLDFIDFCFDSIGVPTKGTDGGIAARSLYRAYSTYCKDTGRKPKSETAFGRELMQDLKHIGYNIKKERTNSGNVYLGLMPNGNEEAFPYHETIEVKSEVLQNGVF